MLVPVTILAYKRPEYLRRTLANIKTSFEFAKLQDPSLEFILVPSVEPGNEEVRSIVESIDFVDCKPSFNPTRLGMNQNTYRSFELAFQYGDVLLQTEEDSLLYF
jgi:hypothetical protein